MVTKDYEKKKDQDSGINTGLNKENYKFRERFKEERFPKI